MAAKSMTKAGPVTLALGLIGGGLALLLYNLGAVASLGWIWKLWPVLLIGIGVEYFFKKSFNREEEVHFHVPSIILMLVLIMVGGTAYAVTSVGRNIDWFPDGMPWNNEGRMTYSRSWDSGAVQINDGERLVVENQLGLINLLPVEGEDVQVHAVIRSPETGPARELAETLKPGVKRTDAGVMVKVPESDYWEGNNRVVTDLDVMVPDGISVEVQSGTGRVTADDLEADVKIVGNASTVELHNVNGKIEARNNTGRMEITNPGGDVTAQTDTGSIEMSADQALSGNYKLTNNTGRLSLEMPGNSNLKINAVSRTGNVSVTGLTGGNTRRDGPGGEYNNTMGSGKGRAELEVGTGSIHITVR